MNVYLIPHISSSEQERNSAANALLHGPHWTNMIYIYQSLGENSMSCIQMHVKSGNNSFADLQAAAENPLISSNAADKTKFMIFLQS